MTTDIDTMRGLLEAIQNTASDETYFKPLDELTEQLPAILDELEAARAETARLGEMLRLNGLGLDGNPMHYNHRCMSEHMIRLDLTGGIG